MIMPHHITKAGLFAVLLLSGTVLTACKSVSEPTPELQAELCPMPQGHNLDAAFTQVRAALDQQRRECAPLFDIYWNKLLAIAEGAPEPENKQLFSNFLVDLSADGIISERQAQKLYNRYFNVKFVSIMGDYSICSQACPARTTVMAEMAQELSDKEQGLLRIGTDRASYQRADQLLKETELVLEATCASCTVTR